MSHSVWKGALSFGLINIPVRVYSASRSRELKFHLLHKKELSRIRYARICESEGKEVAWEDIVKGFEVEPDNYVVLSDEDFEKANLKKTKSIEILDFTEEDKIDTIYYETPYYLEPEKGAEKAYVLLREALQESEKAAVGRFVVHHREHLGVIRPHGQILVLHQLRFDSEIIDPKKLNIPKKEPVSKKELNIALELIDKLTKPFKPEEYRDTYTEEIKEVIAQKAKGKKITLKKGKVPQSTKARDIMSLLKKSLDQHKRARRAKTAPRAA